ncbi:MAG: ABC transporter transmembrane domain-containing protein [Pseudomonadota bacterium]
MTDDALQRPKGRSVRPLRALWPFLAPYKGRLVLAAAVLLIAAGAMLALPIAARFVIDEGFGASDTALVNRYFVGFFILSVLFGLFAALRFYLVIWLGERVVADLRNAVYARVVAMDATFFEVTRTGEVLSRLTTDTTLVQSIAGAGLSIALRSTLTLVGGLAMLLYTNIVLTAYMLALMPVIIVPLLAVGRRIRRLSNTAQEKIADSSALADETLNAIQTVQAFTLEDNQLDRFRDRISESFTAAIRRIRVRALLTALAVTLIFGAMTLVLWLGSRSVMSGTLTVGLLSQFVLYSMFVGGAAAALSELWGEIMRAAGAMERIAELLAVEPAIAAPLQPAKLPEPVRGSIRYDGVRFNYPSRPETPALEDFALDIEAGETVAFVGPSGAGKSTAFQLLLRFYDPQHGRITIDGVNVADLDPRELRRVIGLVPQETALFAESALENIRFGRPDASDAEVIAAARSAAADEFIDRLPDRYQTFLGERGQRLSGGQRQRIAIARAFLKNPPILLLDEATSSLDAASERLVQDAMQTLKQGRTTLIIAHRLATTKTADRIVLLDHGRIAATGQHEQLLVESPLYARLCELQLSDDPSRVPMDLAPPPEMPTGSQRS